MPSVAKPCTDGPSMTTCLHPRRLRLLGPCCRWRCTSTRRTRRRCSDIAERTATPPALPRADPARAESAGLVQSKRGVGGGYVLARGPGRHPPRPRSSRRSTGRSRLGDFGEPHQDGACDHEGQCVLLAIWKIGRRADAATCSRRFTLAESRMARHAVAAAASPPWPEARLQDGLGYVRAGRRAARVSSSGSGDGRTTARWLSEMTDGECRPRAGTAAATTSRDGSAVRAVADHGWPMQRRGGPGSGACVRISRRHSRARRASRRGRSSDSTCAGARAGLAVDHDGHPHRIAMIPTDRSVDDAVRRLARWPHTSVR